MNMSFNPRATPPRILVIDDAATVRLFYRHLLQQAGYQVEEAMNGIEALEKLAQADVDLCIVDVNMPLMDGHSFLARLRRLPQTSALPALVTTTQDAPRDKLAALRAGATDFLVKPVTPETLLRRVATALGQMPPSS
jgi:two-component system chemotaxis response regulator CheY